MISQHDTVTLPGLKKLWAETTGSPEIVIAVLDGPADLSHPCFNGADITIVSDDEFSVSASGTAAQHGTHVASIIFGQHGSEVQGIAPKCRGLLVPVFADEPNGGLSPCSQIDLARAITQAVQAGAHVINISGGQLAPSGEADRLLMNAIRLCQERDVLLVAAAGNDGCDCLHVPAALETVLAVGGMDSQGRPVSASNWGKAYQSQGILAPGENILGALPSGGTVRRSGTSFAAPIVAGVAGLLLSLLRQQGKQPSPHAVREILLRNVLPCNLPEGTEQQRCLAGRLNVSGSHLSLTNYSAQGGSVMSENEAMVIPSACGCGAAKEEEVIEQAAAAEAEGIQPSAVAAAPAPAAVTPSAGCPSCPGGAKLVYALGELGTDFGNEARKDSFTQDMMGASLLDYLAKNPWAAQNLIWTLNLDATPIYAIVPQGPFASVAYERLRGFLADGQIERVSIPGYIGGTIKLMSGQMVPVIVPEVRGMYSWTLGALAEAAVSNMRASAEVSEERARMADSQLRDYLNRVYYDYRNLGITPQERALNFSATNAFQITSVLVTETNEGQRRVLDEITVEKSPLCRPDSDCYDVKLTFFDPDNTLRSRRVYRYTVDVSEVLPVTIGKVRSWAQS